MRMKKGMIAAALAVVMTLGSICAFAAEVSPIPTPSPDGYRDYNVQDHKDVEVTSDIVNNKGHVDKIEGTQDSTNAQTVTLRVARNEAGEEVPITFVGNGDTGLFDSKAGRKITRVNLKSTRNMTLKKNSFSKSNVKKIVVSKKTPVTFKKNCFKGTNVTNPNITLNVAKSADVNASNGAFNGLSSKATITIKCKKSSTYKLTMKKLIAAGFKGKITWVQG